MKPILTVLIVVIFCMFLASAVAADGLITVDPNTPAAGSTPAEETGLSADARLAQKVTYRARHKSLKTILDDLSQTTGVALFAGYNDRDWQVRDRKMNIFVEEVTLAELMSSISRVMKFKWSINQDIQPRTYRLYMDRTTIAAAEGERRQAEERYSQEIRDRRQELADSIMKSDSLSQDEWDRLKDENPYLHLMHKSGRDKLMRTLFNEIPGLLDAFVNANRRVVPPTADLSPEAREMLFDVIENTWGLRHKGEQVPDDLHTSILEGKGQLNFEIIPREFTNWKRRQHIDFGGMGAYINGKWYPVVQFDALESRAAQVWAQADLCSLEGDNAAAERLLAQADSAWAADMQDIEDYLPLEPVVEHEDEPWMREKIIISVQEDEFPDVLAALAEAGEVPIVSDSFALTPGSADFTGTEQELGTVLSAIEQGYRYNWEKHGEIIEFRNREWFRKRGVQIPDEWVEKWRDSFRETGYLSVDDYAQMAILSNDQIEENLMTDKVFGKVDMYGWDLINYRDVLRLYASLNSKQRKMIYSEALMDVYELSPDQMQTLLKFFDLDKHKPDEFTNAPVRLRAHIFGEPNDQHRFELAALGPENAWIQNWHFLLPKYDKKYEEDAQDSESGSSESTE